MGSWQAHGATTQPQQTQIDTKTSMEDLDGALLLRTQNVRFKHDYSFYAIRPSPGKLVLFPGYVPHCVHPASSDVRISVAANISKVEGDERVVRVSGWCNVNGRGDFNLLHTHGDAVFACVLYL